MNFNYSEEQRLLRDSLQRWLQQHYSHDTRMQIAASEAGISKDLYKELCDLGAGAALLPESSGGLGGSGFDIAVVFEEFGRTLLLEPFLPSVLVCGQLLASAGQQDLVDALISGDQLASLAHAEPDSRFELNCVSATAQNEAGNWLLNGHKSMVPNGDNADYFLVSARTSGALTDESGISLFIVNRGHPGITIAGYPTVEGGRAAELHLNNVEVADGALVIAEQEGFAAIEKATAASIVAVCAEALGAMEFCKAATTEYLQTRQQFGVPLGRFQALQHRLVDVLIEIEQARSSVINAAGHLHSDRVVREKHASAAKNLVGRVSRLVAEECTQMHGGIAMTWEYSVPHYVKRLVMIDHLFGDTDHHLQRFIAMSQAEEATT